MQCAYIPTELPFACHRCWLGTPGPTLYYSTTLSHDLGRDMRASHHHTESQKKMLLKSTLLCQKRISSGMTLPLPPPPLPLFWEGGENSWRVEESLREGEKELLLGEGGEGGGVTKS